MEKSNGRIEEEKAILDKIQDIFDSAAHIRSFKIEICGSNAEVTTIRYDIQEFIKPQRKEPIDEQNIRSGNETI